MLEIVSKDLVRAIKDQFQINWQGIHGLSHLARVWENGIHLAEATGANKKVVQLFAVFHDSRRLNENIDPEHGPRGALLAESWRGKYYNLSDEEFDLLFTACSLHTKAKLMWTERFKPVSIQTGLILVGLEKYLIQSFFVPKQPKTSKLLNGRLNGVSAGTYQIIFSDSTHKNSGTQMEQITFFENKNIIFPKS